VQAVRSPARFLTSVSACKVACKPVEAGVPLTGIASDLSAGLTSNELHPMTNVFCCSSCCINACCWMLATSAAERINCGGIFPVATVFSTNINSTITVLATTNKTIYCFKHQKQISYEHLSIFTALGDAYLMTSLPLLVSYNKHSFYVTTNSAATWGTLLNSIPANLSRHMKIHLKTCESGSDDNQSLVPWATTYFQKNFTINLSACLFARFHCKTTNTYTWKNYLLTST